MIRIPKSKEDVSCVVDVNQVTIDQILPIADELLEWMADYNWPVSKVIAPVLLNHINEIKDSVIKVLRDIDTEWSYTIVTVLLADYRGKLDPIVCEELLDMLVDNKRNDNLQGPILEILKYQLNHY